MDDEDDGTRGIKGCEGERNFKSKCKLALGLSIVAQHVSSHSHIPQSHFIYID